MAELQGDPRGLLALGEQTPLWSTMVAGARYARTVHLPALEIRVGEREYA